METRVILLLFLINLNRCALCASSVHQLSQLSQRSLSAFVLAVSLVTDHAPESPLRLSLNSRSTVAFIRSPRQLLQSDTGVPHFALDPLTYRCLLSLSPAADFAEPRPPRHNHILLMKVKTHESQNAEEGYVFRLSAPETTLQNIKLIHKLELLSLEILLSLSERPSCQQHLVSTSRVVLCDLDNFKLRPSLAVCRQILLDNTV